MLSRSLTLLLFAASAAAQCELHTFAGPQPDESSERLGTSVAMHGSTVLLGAPWDDALASNSGSAVLFEGLDAGATMHVLVPSDGGPDDNLGRAVALGEDLALVGAPGGYPSSHHTGAVYVFERVASVWVETAKLTASDAAASKEFGFQIALDGERAVIGSSGLLNAAAYPERAYVFERGPGGWSEVAKFTNSDGDLGDYFAHAVALNGDTALLGARNDSEAGQLTGSVTVIEDQGGGWLTTALITASDSEWNDHFGHAVAIDGDSALVSALGAGAVYVLERSGGVWSETQKLMGSQADAFGWAVALDGDLAVVSAKDGDDGRGRLHVYQRTASRWIEVATLSRPSTDTDVDLGEALALEGTLLLVGAPGQEHGGFGATGLAPLYRASLGVATCSAHANSTGFPATLSALGACNAASNQLQLWAADLPNLKPALFLASQSPGFVPNLGGSQGDLCLGASIGRFSDQVQQIAGGVARINVDLTDLPSPLPPAVLPGDSYHFQVWYRDGTSSNFTNAIEIAFH